MNHIALAGVKHTGKSTKGRLLAQAHRGVFTDLDDLILEKLPRGYSIRKWYTEKGAECFMELERSALESYLNEPEDKFRCLALGGGTLENPSALRLLKNSSLCLCGLIDREEVLLERILRKGIPPFLDAENPEESFHRLYEMRNKTIRDHSDILIDMEDLSIDKAVKAIEQAFSAFNRKIR